MASQTLFYAASVLMMLALRGVTAEPTSVSNNEPSHREKRNLLQFKNMIEAVTGRSAWDYNGYGCYCGSGGSGVPVDGIDRCCQVHDRCYDIEVEWAKWITYDYTAGRGWVNCEDDLGTSDRAACDCDREAVLCFNSHVYDGSVHCPCSSVPEIESLDEDTCLQYAKDGNCDFYIGCLEDEHSCDEKGYAACYGYRYCTRFHTFYDYFNNEGKIWINDTNKCLTNELKPVYKAFWYSCDKIETTAFSSHAKCYTASGNRFCRVFWANIDALLKVFEVCDFREEDSDSAIEQILLTGLQCLCDNSVAGDIQRVVDATNKVWNKVFECTTQLWQVNAKAGIQTECLENALEGKCDFYNCLERRHPCGRKGFALQEGLSFSEGLKTKKGRFNTQGQNFVTAFTKCMTRSLLPEYRNDAVSCRHIKNLGYRAQDSCFVEAGICDLVENKENEFALWHISKVLDVSRFHLQLSTILCRCQKFEGGNRYKVKYTQEGRRLKQKAPVVDESSPADLPCTSQGGKCQDYSVRTCLAGYQTGKCGGNALRRCCLHCDSWCESAHQTWSTDDSDCANAGGQCKTDTNFCYGQYRTGLCGGPARRRCCVVGPSDASMADAGSQSPCGRLTNKSRDDWGAQTPRQIEPLAHPTQKVVIHHTDSRLTDITNINGYTDVQEYVERVQDIQEDHMDDNRWDDIGFNFLIDGFGNVYEGRGWDTKGAHAYAYNSVSIGIGIIGYFENELPKAAALEATLNLIACGVDMGKINTTYELNCHSDLGAENGDTECPGTALCDLVKTNFLGF